MKKLSNYIFEKLKINKDSEITKKVEIPKSKEEFKEFIDTYFREWYEYDNKVLNHGKPINEKFYKATLDVILNYIDQPGFDIKVAFEQKCPFKFIYWMNEHYKLNYKFSH